MRLTHTLFAGAILVSVVGCGQQPAVTAPVGQPAPQVQAQANASSFPAYIENSKIVPLKYDNQGRLGRLALKFKARFAGVIPDETMIWEVNGGEKRSGYYSGF